MKIRRIEATANQLERLTSDLCTVPDKPPGTCLGDEQFADYALGKMNQREMDLLDEHLAGCTACAKTLEHILAECEGPRNIIKLGFTAAAGSWAAFTRAPIRKAAAGFDVRPIWEWRSSDGSSAAHALREPNGNLTFRFSSTDLRLTDRSVSVRSGGKYFQARLERVSDTEVGGKVVIPRDEQPDDLAQIALEMN